MASKTDEAVELRTHLNDAAALALDAFSSIRQAAAVSGVPLENESPAPTDAEGGHLRIDLRARYHYAQAEAAINAVEEVLSELRDFSNDLDVLDGPYDALRLHTKYNLHSTVDSIAGTLEESINWLTSRMLAELHELVGFAELAARLGGS